MTLGKSKQNNSVFVELPVITIKLGDIKDFHGGNRSIMHIDKKYNISVNKNSINLIYPLNAAADEIYGLMPDELRKCKYETAIESKDITTECSVIYINGIQKEFIINVSYDALQKKLGIKKVETPDGDFLINKGKVGIPLKTINVIPPTIEKPVKKAEKKIEKKLVVTNVGDIYHPSLRTNISNYPYIKSYGYDDFDDDYRSDNYFGFYSD